jgi:hypothetical protein
MRRGVGLWLGFLCLGLWGSGFRATRFPFRSGWACTHPLGLSLSKPCYRTPVRAEVSKPFTTPPFGLRYRSLAPIQTAGSSQRSGAALSPRRATHFLLLRQEKVSKEKATLLSASLRCATGDLRCSVQPGSSSNSLRSDNRSPCSVWTSAPRRIQKGWGANSNSGSIEPAARA